jgi:hypothetical protein
LTDPNRTILLDLQQAARAEVARALSVDGGNRRESCRPIFSKR